MANTTTPKFKNADGTLTVYAFGCGYVEETDGPTYGVRLWLDGVWHVRRHHTAPGMAGYIRESWESFDTLGDARKFYRKERRAVLAA